VDEPPEVRRVDDRRAEEDRRSIAEAEQRQARQREADDMRAKRWKRIENMAHMIAGGWTEPRVLGVQSAVLEDEFASKEIDVQSQRMARVMEVFLSRESMPATPQEAPIESYPKNYAPKPLPLHSVRACFSAR
jgi:hypothetical protein